MLRRPPKSTRTDTLCPYTTLFRSHAPVCLSHVGEGWPGGVDSRCHRAGRQCAAVHHVASPGHSRTGGSGGIRAGKPAHPLPRDRKSVVEGKSVSVRVDLGWRRIIKKKKQEDTIASPKTQIHKDRKKNN